MSPFSKFVKDKRKALGLTQPELAEKVFGDARRKSYISALENGKKDVPESTMMAILESLGCKIQFVE